MSTVTRTAQFRPTPPAPRRRRRGRGLVKALVAVVLLAVLAVGAGWVLTPSVSDADTLVAQYLAAHHGTPLQGDVPPKVARALIATEDSRFYDNPGVDPLSVLRAPLAFVFHRDEGGATLEQQLAKNLYVGGRIGGLDSVEAAELALKLDRSWSKAQILRMYLDDGYYGHGYYGLEAASRGYFGVAPADLTWAQASLLAGLFQAPSAYDPVTHPDAARARQAHVLDRLVATGALSRADADAVAAESWGLRGGR